MTKHTMAQRTRTSESPDFLQQMIGCRFLQKRRSSLTDRRYIPTSGFYWQKSPEALMYPRIRCKIAGDQHSAANLAAE